MDADGSFTIGTKKQKSGALRTELRLVGYNSDTQILKFLQSLFGGSIQQVKRYSTNHSPQYVWVLTGTRASKAAELLLPYLIRKNKQAEVFVRFGRDLVGGETRTTAIQQIRALNAPQPSRSNWNPCTDG